MKDALDYARQALRFAERAMEPEVTDLRMAWNDAYVDGQREARRKNASERSREAFAYECPREAEEAMRSARASLRPDIGWWAESWRTHACESAKRAAWCAGYAGA